MTYSKLFANKLKSIPILPCLLSVTYLLISIIIPESIQLLNKSTVQEKQMMLELSQNPINEQVEEQTFQDLDITAIGTVKDSLIESYSAYAHFLAIMLILHSGVRFFVNGANLLRRVYKQLRHLKCKANNESLREIVEPTQMPFECGIYIIMMQTVKSVVITVLVLIVQYSALYFVCHVLFISFYFIFHYPFCMLFKQGDLAPEDNGQEEQRTYPLFQREDSSSMYVGSKQQGNRLVYPLSKQNNDRILSVQGTVDIVNIISSTQILEDEPIKTWISLSHDEKTAIIVTEYRIIHVNISSLISPIVHQRISPSLDDTLEVILVSPNGQLTFCTDFDDNMYIRNLSDPYRVMKLNFEATQGEKFNTALDMPVVFSPDGITGYFITPSLYRFKVTSPDTTKVLNLTDDNKPEALKLSSNGSIAFLGLSANFGFSTILIIDLSNQDSPQILASHTIAHSISSLGVSSDDTKLFVFKDHDFSLEILDITNLSSVISISHTLITGISYDYSVISQGTSIHTTDEGLVISVFGSIIVVDLSNLVNLTYYVSQALYTDSLALLSDGKTMLAINENQDLLITELFINRELHQRFTVPNFRMTSVPIFNGSGIAYSVALSSDNKSVFVACSQGLQIFEIIPGQIPVIPEDVIQTDRPLKSVVLSTDGRTVFASAEDELFVIDTTEKQVVKNVSLKSTDFKILPNQDVLIRLTTIDSKLHLEIINVSNITQKVEPNYIPVGDTSNSLDGIGIVMALSEQYLILGYIDQINIYSTPNLTSLNLLNSFLITYEIDAVSISLDSRFLYVVLKDDASKHIFVTYDISDLENINQVGSVDIPFVEQMETIEKISINQDMAYVFMMSRILIIDIANPKSPWIVNFLSTATESAENFSFITSSNSAADLLLFTNHTENLYFIDLKPQYTLHMSVQTLFIGKPIIDNLVLWQRNTISRYNLMQQGYKLIQTSLYNIEINRKAINQSYPSLPSWMNIDQANRVLTADPSSKDDIGIYQIASSISTQILFSAFDSITQNPSELVYILISLQYIDNECYLTPSFSPNEPLKFLPSPYNASEVAIREALSAHYFEMLAPISVESSLKLDTHPPHIQIDTPSQLLISLTITLVEKTAASEGETPLCRFLKDINSVLVPNVDARNTTIKLEGPLFDINQALQLVTIDLATTKTSCDGILTIEDGLNYARTNETIQNISALFRHNQAPQDLLSKNFTVRDEIRSISIYMGTYFVFHFDERRFNDTSLQYTLRNPELTPWLTLNGLSLSGTPPEQLWPLTANVEIVVSNQFKSTTLPLSLDVKYGAGYIFAISWKIVGLIGLWIYLHMIFNIFGKNLYRYPQDFIIPVGTEISQDQIAPIAFLATELKESRFIIKELERSVARELGRRFIRRSQLAEHFLDPAGQQIDVHRLMKAIEDIVITLRKTKSQRVKYYAQNLNSRKDLINQLIINEIVMRQLDLPQEYLTQQAFQELKIKWTSFLQHEKDAPSWRLSIDQAKVMQELEVRGINLNQTQQSRDKHSKNNENQLELSRRHTMKSEAIVNLTDNSNRSHSLFSSSLTTKLLEDTEDDKRGEKSVYSTQLNLNLLNNALTAHVYKQHHLNAHAIKVAVTVKEKVEKVRWLPTILARFLKLDLRTVLFATGNTIGYGMECKINDDVIHFYGIASRNFEGKTIVVQLSKRRRILRELWLHGTRGNSKETIFFENQTSLQSV